MDLVTFTEEILNGKFHLLHYVMVKLTKKVLEMIVKNRLFTEEALSTFLAEVESITNNCPLTPIRDDIDVLEPFTPNHFLLDRLSTNRVSQVLKTLT